MIFENPGDDQPKKLTYGPAFFQSYHTLGDVQYIHGLNFVQNDSVAQLEAATTAACKSIGESLDLLELGNEPNVDLISDNMPLTYTIDDHIADWNWKSGVVASAVNETCPGRTANFMAPSFMLFSSNIAELLPFDDEAFPPGWSLEGLFDGGYDTTLVKQLSIHK